MPIRINLLAEEQAAEEMRRRDPIKRAIYIGAALTGIMLFWIAITQMNVIAAKRELADFEARFQKVDDASKQVRNDQVTAADFQAKIKALHRYSTNRLLWGTLLDALQHDVVDNVRLTDLRAEQRHESGEVHKFFTTNVTIEYIPPPPWWKPWVQVKASAPIAAMASNSLVNITNKAPFTTNLLNYAIKVNPTSTNAERAQLIAQLEFSNPAWSMERTVIEIRGRDYGSPSGAAIDEFARRIQNSPLLKDLLVPVEGFKFTERPPQARTDPQDLEKPDALFVPFTVELTFKNRIFANE
jgi:hypothetical protein